VGGGVSVMLTRPEVSRSRSFKVKAKATATCSPVTSLVFTHSLENSHGEQSPYCYSMIGNIVKINLILTKDV